MCVCVHGGCNSELNLGVCVSYMSPETDKAKTTKQVGSPIQLSTIHTRHEVGMIVVLQVTVMQQEQHAMAAISAVGAVGKTGVSVPSHFSAGKWMERLCGGQSVYTF